MLWRVQGIGQTGLGGRENREGSDRLSHAVPRAVPPALAGFTAVFGMETGGFLPP